MKIMMVIQSLVKRWRPFPEKNKKNHPFCDLVFIVTEYDEHPVSDLETIFGSHEDFATRDFEILNVSFVVIVLRVNVLPPPHRSYMFVS